MAIKRSITKDPRWIDFVKRYQDNFALFAEEVCGRVPTHQQVELFTAIGEINNRVSVASGTGTGKSSGTAILAMCFMTTYIDARVCITAVKVQQVMIGVMKNLAVYWKVAIKRFPWLEDYFVLNDQSFYCRESKLPWSLAVKGYKVNQEEALAGEHSAHLLYIVDEASGLGDAAFDKITGTLTESDNRLLLLSQPTRNDGFFYRTHHDLKMDPESPSVGSFTALVFNSEDSPIVTDFSIIAKYTEYGGRDSVEYLIRVRGLFADNLSGNLISRTLVNEGFLVKIKHEEDWGYVITCDVAGGNHRDSCVYSIGRVSGYGETRNIEVIKTVELPGDKGAVDFARILIEEVIPHYQNVTVAVDKGAMGGEMIQELERYNIQNVVEVVWGGPVHAKSLKSRYFNKRAYACCMVRDALRYGRMSLYNGTKILKDKLIKQFINLPFAYAENGHGLQLQMMPKPEMKKKGIASPDILDTHAFFFMCDYIAVGDTEMNTDDGQLVDASLGAKYGDYIAI